MVLEKTLECPLDCKEIQPVHPKGNRSWVFILRTDVKAETPILWPLDAKNWKSESETEVAQSCLTLCNPMDCNLLGFYVHGIFQARILDWVAISFFRGSSQPRNPSWVSHIAGRLFTVHQGILTLCAGKYIGLAKKFVQIFSSHSMEKSERTFGPNIYIYIYIYI